MELTPENVELLTDAAVRIGQQLGLVAIGIIGGCWALVAWANALRAKWTKG